MDVIKVQGLPPIPDDPAILAIGKFDGMHIGHQKILDVAKQHQGKHALSVMSFWPHPAFVLSGRDTYRLALTPFEEKCRRLAAEGVDRLYAVEFTRDFAAITPQAFVHHHLQPLHLTGVVVGEDFRFGQGGSGDTNQLTALCGQSGIPVHVVQPVSEGGVKVSSSQIREHLEQGRVEAAEALLGRPYAVQGSVIHGDARGRQIGFPTANLKLEDDAYVLPSPGVYAVSVVIQSEGMTARGHRFGVMNAGYRPTVEGTTFRLEVHLLDFDGDLYGQTLRVSFLRRVRDEMKFPGLDALRQQIQTDVHTVRQLFLGEA